MERREEKRRERRDIEREGRRDRERERERNKRKEKRHIQKQDIDCARYLILMYCHPASNRERPHPAQFFFFEKGVLS